MYHTLLKQLNNLSRLILPSQCLGCYAATTHVSSLCELCLQELPILQQKCALCAQYLPAEKKNTTLCHACLNKKLPFNALFVGYPYQKPISHWISLLKFHQQLSYAQLMGQLLTHKIIYQWYTHRKLPSLIIPVPLHTRRLQERGFNQALEIVRPIAATLNIPLDTKGIIRSKSTLAQSGLSSAERKRNMTGAFNVTRRYYGQTIAVLDDVVTTGQTIFEICQLLKAQGAQIIDVWCCARVF